MLVDWFTVFAQAVNFLVLVLVLRHLLYRRVLTAVERREADIAGRIEEAQRIREAADADAQGYREQLAHLEGEKQRLLAEARAAAEDTRRELTEKARTEVADQQTRWESALRREQEAALSAIGKRLVGPILEIVRRILDDLTGRDLREAAVDVFLTRIEQADPGIWSRLSASVAEGQVVTVESTGAIDEARQGRIRELLASQLGRSVDVRFEVDPERVLGVVLRGGGIKIGWTVDGYLRRLEREAERELDETVSPERT